MLSISSAILLTSAVLVSGAPTTSDQPPDYSCVSDNSGFYLGGYVTPCNAGEVCQVVAGGNPCLPPNWNSATAASSATSAAATATSTASDNTATTGTSAVTSSAAGATASMQPLPSALPSREYPGNRYVVYWPVWENAQKLPSVDQLKGVTHIILSSADMDKWKYIANYDPSSQGQFDSSTPGLLRNVLGGNSNLKVMASFGGWGLDSQFRKHAQANDMAGLANQIVSFVRDNGLDGADIDWEYPVGNGALWKQESNAEYTEINAFVTLMQEIRKLDDKMILSIAVPSKAGDALAYTSESVPVMDGYLDFWNLMTYDFVNRRDTKTGHHSGGQVIHEAIGLYAGFGLPKTKMNAGFAMYSKFWSLPQDTTCSNENPIGCDMLKGENDADGSDNWTSGAWRFGASANVRPSVIAGDPTAPPERQAIFDKAQSSWSKVPQDTSSRDDALASAYVDLDSKLFWSWTSKGDMLGACQKYKPEVGGVMVWSVNQDVNIEAGGEHFAALATCVT